MAKQVVIFHEGASDNALYLKNVQFSPDGGVESGFVLNGWWQYERHEYPGTHVIIDVPEDKQGNYNTVIDWARTQLEGNISGT